MVKGYLHEAEASEFKLSKLTLVNASASDKLLPFCASLKQGGATCLDCASFLASFHRECTRAKARVTCSRNIQKRLYFSL